jgi:prephenate dehydrogenase
MTITIIGTGLIGGSLALGLRGFQTKFIGVDKNAEHAKLALELGLVDAVLELKEAVKISDLIIIAIPVDSAREILPKILDEINDETVVTDMGSTKAGICKAVENHKRRRNFVAAHPIAGTEYSGPKAAIHGLFNEKTAIIADKELSSDFALQTVEKMFKLLNMRIIYMESEKHDLHIAYVSHLSHISSFTLGLTVLEIEKDEAQIFNMAGSGFASTVRLAKSSPEMWAPIFVQNAEYLSKALDIYIENLKKFKNVIDNKLSEEAKILMKKANEIKRIIN